MYGGTLNASIQQAGIIQAGQHVVVDPEKYRDATGDQLRLIRQLGVDEYERRRLAGTLPQAG